MTDDARRALSEDERTLIQAARARGDVCAGCGRALAVGEPVWWAAFAVSGAYGRRSRQWAPVGRECAPPELVREAEAKGPERCLGCARDIYYGSIGYPRDLVLCSKRCRGRYDVARSKEERR